MFEVHFNIPVMTLDDNALLSPPSTVHLSMWPPILLAYRIGIHTTFTIGTDRVLSYVISRQLCCVILPLFASSIFLLSNFHFGMDNPAFGRDLPKIPLVTNWNGAPPKFKNPEFLEIPAKVLIIALNNFSLIVLIVRLSPQAFQL